MTVHKNLTGADLHEPKGADTALSGQVYVANGSGSGVWTDATTIITNSAFTTGDTKFTLKTSADTGWILGSAGSIGDGSSGATVRANSDTSALFTLLWTNFSNTLCPVSGGRGASAAADFAAHKTLTLPDMWQRTIGVAGSYNGSGQSTRTLGEIVGAETISLSVSQIPTLTTGVTGVAVAPNGQNFATGTGTISVSTSAGGSLIIANPIANSSSASVTASGTTSGTGGATGSAHSNMQPTVFINIMIKL